MPQLTFYSAFLATLISVIGLSRIAYKEHDKRQPRTLSELVASERSLLNHFRNLLWLCGTLFAITMYLVVVPRARYSALIALAWSLEYISDLVLAIVPARHKTVRLHEFFAQVLATGMLGLAYLFWFDLHGVYALLEMSIAIAMTILAVLTITDKRRFIFYELPFIFFSHVSILIAAIALR